MITELKIKISWISGEASYKAVFKRTWKANTGSGQSLVAPMTLEPFPSFKCVTYCF